MYLNDTSRCLVCTLYGSVYLLITDGSLHDMPTMSGGKALAPIHLVKSKGETEAMTCFPFNARLPMEMDIL